MTSKLLRFGSYSLIGLGGCVTGIFIEKYAYQDYLPFQSFNKHLPGLPIFGTVSAATPIYKSAEVTVYNAEIKPSRVSEVSLTNVCL